MCYMCYPLSQPFALEDKWDGGKRRAAGKNQTRKGGTCKRKTEKEKYNKRKW